LYFAFKEFITVRLDSGIEAVINVNNLVDDIRKPPSDVVKKGQPVTGVVVQTKLDFDHDELIVGISTRPQDLKEGDRMFRRVQFDEAWDHTRLTKR
jgi:ribosomal protein S1